MGGWGDREGEGEEEMSGKPLMKGIERRELDEPGGLILGRTLKSDGPAEDAALGVGGAAVKSSKSSNDEGAGNADDEAATGVA